jgi:hypothetical protein
MNWISVKHRLPPEPKSTDIYRKTYYVYLDETFGCRYATWVYVGNGKWWREDIDAIETESVTHWSLPSPPSNTVANTAI